MINMTARFAVMAVIALNPLAAHANGVGENAAWQFQTIAELANQAYIEELRRKNASGAYQAPQYNYYIDTQNNFNCSNSASSSGNGGTNSATANTPTSNGANGSALGNQNSSTGSTQGWTGDVVLNSGQDNYGPVLTSVTGDSYADASNNLSHQALNTVQTNTGLQDASINGSNGCSFATPVGYGQ